MYQNKSQSLIKSANCEAIEEEYFLTMPKGLRLSQFLYHTSGNIYYNYNQLLMQKYTQDLISTGTCTPFSKKLFFAVDGKILPCERIDHDFEVGYVREKYVELDYKHVAERHNYYLSRVAKERLTCKPVPFVFNVSITSMISEIQFPIVPASIHGNSTIMKKSKILVISGNILITTKEY